MKVFLLWIVVWGVLLDISMDALVGKQTEFVLNTDVAASEVFGAIYCRYKLTLAP